MKRNLNLFFPKTFLVTLATVLFLLFIYSLLRLGFVIYNRPLFESISPLQLGMAFVHGLRFDLSGLLMLNAAFFTIYNLPKCPIRNRIFHNIIFALFCLVNLTGIFLTLIDYAYYPVVLRRISYEPFVVPVESLTMLSGMVGDYGMLLLLGIAIGAGFILVNHKLFSHLKRKQVYKFYFLRDSIFLILIIGLMVLGIRGGLQSKPIRPSHAFFSAERSLGYVSLNTPFNIIISFNQIMPAGRIPLCDHNDSRRTVQEMLYRPDEANIVSYLPFLRQPVTTVSPEKFNVVVFIMESWSAGYIGALGADPSATPFFDQLSFNGLLFTNFISNGQRSVEAISAIVASIPNLLSAPIVGSRFELKKILGMGTIFAHQGYGTSFHHGAKTGSMDFDVYSRLAGFDNYFGKEDIIHQSRQIEDGTWGIYDHIFFSDVVSRLNRFQQPFCTVVYSLSPHDPLKIPDELQSKFAAFAHEDRYRQALRYSDYSLRIFFEQAKTQQWFNRTIFVIVGDHPYNPNHKDFLSAFHVPLLIFAPALIAPGRDNRIASQVDILPTLLDLLRISRAHSSMGMSLVHSSAERFAVVQYQGRYCFLTDDFVWLSNLDQPGELYNYRLDPQLKRSLTKDRPSQAEWLNQKLLSYLCEVTYAITQDKICRTEDLRYYHP